jgi:hypothetical protein
MKYRQWVPVLAIPAMVFLGAWSCHPDAVQVCSGGKCATVAPASSARSTQASGQPNPTVTVTQPGPTVTQSCHDPDHDSDCDHHNENDGQ